MLRNVLLGTRLVIATVLGWSLIALGLVLLVTPGPGLLALAAGTAILARHYDSVARTRAALVARIARVARRSRPGERPVPTVGAPRTGPMAPRPATSPDPARSVA
jgi:hypothetical protein